MQRRSFLRGLIASFFQPLLWKVASVYAGTERVAIHRVRPSDAAWPSAASWRKLKEAVGGNLIQVQSLFAECESNSTGAACLGATKEIRNPYFIGDQPGGTQISGWLDAWTPDPVPTPSWRETLPT